MDLLPLTNKTKLAFGQDSKVCWSFCFEIKVLNESKYLMPGIRCAFGNVICSKYFTSKRSKGLSGSKMWHRKHSIIIALRISHFFAALKSMFQNLKSSLWQTWYLSRISRIIFVEKKLSCGEIWSFYKEFEQFMEFYQSLCRFCSKSMWRKICVEKICVEKKRQIWGLLGIPWFALRGA